MGFNDHEPIKEKANTTPKVEEKPLIKDRECLHCKKVFDGCKGKMRGVDCVNFVSDGRPQN